MRLVPTSFHHTWRQKRLLNSHMLAVRASKIRNTAQTTGVNQASSEDTTASQQPLEQLVSRTPTARVITQHLHPHIRDKHTLTYLLLRLTISSQDLPCRVHQHSVITMMSYCFPADSIPNRHQMMRSNYTHSCILLLAHKPIFDNLFAAVHS